MVLPRLYSIRPLCRFVTSTFYHTKNSNKVNYRYCSLSRATFSSDNSPKAGNGIIDRLNQMYVEYPKLSLGVMFASEVCSMGLCGFVMNGITFSPDFLMAAALSKALLAPIALPSSLVLTPLIAKVFPVLSRIRIGTVFTRAGKTIKNEIGSVNDSNIESNPKESRFEKLINDYGASGARLLIYMAIVSSIDLSFIYRYFPDSILSASSVVAHLAASATASVIFIPFVLLSPALLIPTLIKLNSKFIK